MFAFSSLSQCLRIAPPDLRARLCQELVEPSVIGLLLKDSFGNYVVQTALAVAESDSALYQYMCNAIRYVVVCVRCFTIALA